MVKREKREIYYDFHSNTDTGRSRLHMYNPALPNHYRDVVFSAYARRRQREEEEARQRQRQPNALASALSSLDSASAFADVHAPEELHLSAEELHLRRIKESAALGIQAAVDMEKEVLESEHKRMRLEGADARSRISSRLDKLKALAAKSKKLSSSGNSGGDSGGAGRGESADGLVSSPVTAVNSATSPAAPSSLSASSAAPLIFQRSSLAAGGYVMTTAATPTAAPTALVPNAFASTAAKSAVQGKPSSTLLLRYCRDSPAVAWSPEEIRQAATATVATTTASSSGSEAAAAADVLCAPILQYVQQLCRRFGSVRAVKARVHTADAVSSVLHISVTDTAAVLREQLRLWVRYDSVAEAFKAAESLSKEPSTAAGPLFNVAFYPTSFFDADTLDLREEDEKASS